MEVVCPKCGFMGNIDDTLIPESGRNVTCKRCKANFFVTKDDLDKSGDRGYESPPDIDAAFAKLKTTNRDVYAVLGAYGIHSMTNNVYATPEFRAKWRHAPSRANVAHTERTLPLSNEIVFFVDSAQAPELVERIKQIAAGDTVDAFRRAGQGDR